MILCHGKMRQYWWVCLLLSLSGGCGPAVVLDYPDHFPEKWSGRKLYHTPNAYIYASNPFAAREADQAVIRVADFFLREKTGATSGKGLVLVTGRWDELIDSDLVFLHDLYLSRQEPPKKKPELSPTELRAVFQRRDEEFRKKGADFATTFKQFAMPLEKDTLVNRFGFPPEALTEVDWAAAIPTVAAMRQAIREDNRELAYGANPFYMLVLLPSIIQGDRWSLDGMVGNRAELLFEQLVLSQPQWTMQEKRELMDSGVTHHFYDLYGKMGPYGDYEEDTTICPSDDEP